MILDIFNKIYSNANFTTILVGSGVTLGFLFIIILLLGLRDSNKIFKKASVTKEINDITFDLPKENEQIKEDVTFEMPLLTKNLEDYKKNIESEISSDRINGEVKPELKDESLFMSTKPFKILDINEIEDTAILPSFIIEEPKSEQAFTTNENEEMLEIVLPKENK